MGPSVYNGESDGAKNLYVLGYTKENKGDIKRPIVIRWCGVLERWQLWSLLNSLYLPVVCDASGCLRCLNTFYLKLNLNMQTLIIFPARPSLRPGKVGLGVHLVTSSSIGIVATCENSGFLPLGNRAWIPQLVAGFLFPGSCLI